MLNNNNVPYIDKQNTDELEFDINPKLTQSQQTQLKIINTYYKDCFAQHSIDLGAIDVRDIPIPTTTTTEPVNLPPYRLTEQQVKIENKGSKFAYRYKYQMLHM